MGWRRGFDISVSRLFLWLYPVTQGSLELREGGKGQPRSLAHGGLGIVPVSKCAFFTVLVVVTPRCTDRGRCLQGVCNLVKKTK